MEAFFNFFDGQALAFLGSAIAVAMCCVEIGRAHV